MGYLHKEVQLLGRSVSCPHTTVHRHHQTKGSDFP